MKEIIETGKVFNNLIIIKEVDGLVQPSGQKQRRFLCKCNLCGNEKPIRLIHLKSGYSKSCGCSLKTQNGESKTPIFKKWKGIIDRCARTNKYRRGGYFDAGIKVCDEWINDFLAFKKWALNNGYSENLTIDRIDNNKGYSPDNCRFITAKENCNNKKNTLYVNYKGEKKAISILIYEKFGKKIHYETILNRIKRGWDIEKAIDTPIKKGNYRKNSITNRNK